MMLRVLVGLLLVVVATLLIGWLAPVHPLFEAVTNVRAQLFPFAFIVLVGMLIQRQWSLAIAAAAVLAICLGYVVPYWFASADPLPADGKTARVMQYNIYFGNEDAVAMARHISQADAAVVVLHEITPGQWETLEPLLVDHPHHIAEPLGAGQGQLGGGMVMLSRQPFDRLVMPSAFSPPDRMVLAGTTDILGEPTLVIGLHPFASRNQTRKAGLRQAQLDGVAELAANSSVPVVIVTDLNVAPTSPQYARFLDALNWRDPHRVVGWQSTWPTWGGPFGLPIDHVFVSNEFALHSYELGSGAGSDHRSVVAEISFVTDGTG